jgi:hypothetical protein
MINSPFGYCYIIRTKKSMLPIIFTSIEYTGDVEAICPITLNKLSEIDYPVAFADATHQPYDCEALVCWLSEKKANPMTNLPVYWIKSPLEILGPLSMVDNYKKNIIKNYIILNLLTPLTKHQDPFPNIEKSLMIYFFMLTLTFYIPTTLAYCWSHNGIMTCGLLHTVYTIKSLNGLIVGITTLYALIASTLFLITTLNQELPIVLVTTSISLNVFFIKCACHFADKYRLPLYPTRS